LFLDFLAGPARQAASLTILGDLFDYWAGDDDLADPFNARIVAALRTLSDSGVRLEFMAGNRDFLIGGDFAAAAGLTLLPDPVVRDIGGIRTLLTHGDALCTDDPDYQRFRAQARDPAWQAAFLARPLDERKREIEALRARSEAEKKIKPLAIMDVNASAVVATLAEQGAQAMIHGHTHRQGRHLHAVAGRECTRWVLGDWHADHGEALVCEPAGWHFSSGDDWFSRGVCAG
jgi:UDP-2,3-diacylglucosamine hydrolase